MANKITWVTKMYLWMKGWSFSEPIVILLQKIQDLLFEVARDITTEESNFAISEIVRQSKKDIPGTEKMQNVINAFKLRFTLNTLGNRALNYFFNGLVLKLTEDGTID